MGQSRGRIVSRLKGTADVPRRDVVETVGIRDAFGPSSADDPSLLERFGLTADAVEAAVKGLLA